MKKITVSLTISSTLLIVSNMVWAQVSPFAHVPIYLVRVEQSKAKSNLMLLIDDSTSMRANVPGDSLKRDRMRVAKDVAIDLVSDETNLAKFRFGLAHLYENVNNHSTVNRIILANIGVIVLRVLRQHTA